MQMRSRTSKWCLSGSLGSDASPPRPQTIVPESLRQRSGAPLFEDFALFLGQHWAFNVSLLPPRLAAATHFWHGTGDLQARALPQQPAAVAPAPGSEMLQCRKAVQEGGHRLSALALTGACMVCGCLSVLQGRAARCCGEMDGGMNAAKSLPTAGRQGQPGGSGGFAHTVVVRAQVPHVTSRALHRLVPGARLTIVPRGGHFAYYVCNQTAQLTALGQLLASAAST